MPTKGPETHDLAARRRDLRSGRGGGVGIAVVVHDADQLLAAGHFPLFVSVLCQGADRANSAVDLDGFPLDRPALSEHFVFESGVRPRADRCSGPTA
jgi:hypothetical protein